MRQRHEWRACKLLLCIALWQEMGDLPAIQAQVATEYQVKAAYVYAFTKFVEWPPSKLSSTTSAIQICVFNNPGLELELSRLISGKSVAGHSMIVRAVKGEEALRECHVLFISSGSASTLRHILESVQGASILTIGEKQGFLDAGGIINLVSQDAHVRFQVNRRAAKAAGIHVSARLLSVATLVLE
jgi:YfiR/HmsC-like